MVDIFPLFIVFKSHCLHGNFFPYVMIAGDQRDYFCGLPDGHIVDKEIFFPYVKTVCE